MNPSAHGYPTFSRDELIGCTYLHKTADGEVFCNKITQKILDQDGANHQKIKFLGNVGENAYIEIIAYSKLSNITECQVEAGMHGKLDTWTFQEIVTQESLLSPHSSHYKGLPYNVCICWSDGSESWELLNVTVKDDPVMLASYAKNNNLLEKPGWKFL